MGSISASSSNELRNECSEERYLAVWRRHHYSVPCFLHTAVELLQSSYVIVRFTLYILAALASYQAQLVC